MQKLVLKKIKVYGIVQGVGFRPMVDRHAHTAGIRGTVSNKGPYVEIYAEGTEQEVDAFLTLLSEQPPKRAAILKIDVKTQETQNVSHFSDFRIIESKKTKGEIFVSPDIAICEECKTELFDRKNRRYLHPFINCTCCGPRLTILDALPYDRERTSMKEFPMCPDCAAEYHSPASRRYDAQPVCCNACGPEVFLLKNPEIRGSAAITKVRAVLSAGGIAAVKGIGGFHLACDAYNEKAVQRLRMLKNRPMKPFAVMMRDLSSAERECEISPRQREILTGHQKPILLLKKKKGSRLSEAVAPSNPTVGVMLPYAPVQLLLFTYDDAAVMPDCLIMTSGNASGAPIARDDQDAEKELSGMCDIILTNNRKIRIRADDSVMDFFRGEPYMIRRSRGYAPLPYLMSEDFRGQVLGMGGELKNTFCLGVNRLFYPSAYIGDLADVRSVKALLESAERMETLLETRPELIACDLHPKYNSGYAAEKLAEEYHVPLVRVQHHYAHVVSCMAENDFSGRVIGVSMDGTGYGTDGTIWGGEILISDLNGFERAGSIAPFLQIGGDSSSRDGWRIAVSMLYETCGRDKNRTLESISRLALCSPADAKVQLVMHDRRLNAVASTSAGRLFDAVSAVVLKRLHSTFEGEASMALQFSAEAFAERLEAENRISGISGKHPVRNSWDACRKRWEMQYPGIKKCKAAAGGMEGTGSSADGEGAVVSVPEGRFILPTDALFSFIKEEQLLYMDRQNGQDCQDGIDASPEIRQELLSYLFHRALAEMVSDVCILIRGESGPGTAVLTGGVYQNRFLLECTEALLEKAGFHVLIHHLVPPNDGGIGLGQAVAAMQMLRKQKNENSIAAGMAEEAEKCV